MGLVKFDGARGLDEMDRSEAHTIYTEASKVAVNMGYSGTPLCVAVAVVKIMSDSFGIKTSVSMIRQAFEETAQLRSEGFDGEF
jgi:hypothetical protein